VWETGEGRGRDGFVVEEALLAIKEALDNEPGWGEGLVGRSGRGNWKARGPRGEEEKLKRKEGEII
jgi:hypothetical protein